MSTLSLAKNGYVSSSKRTKHIKARYFFVHHYHKAGELDLRYCPREEMWADVLTKPMQGHKFCLFRALLMNCPVDYSEEPCFSPSSTPTLAPSPSKSTPASIKLPCQYPADAPSPMKHRVEATNLSLRGCVEPLSHGACTHAPKCVNAKQVLKQYQPTHHKVSWRDALFPRRSPPATAE